MTDMHVRLALMMLGAGVSASAGAAPAPAPASTIRQAEDPNAALSRYLTVLAANPESLAALVGAARAALALGDGHAALSFFGRAEELAPRDGRIKAGIGSALVLMQQGRDAMTFFNYAVSLGVPEAEFAGDRGLAFDLMGDPRRAQKDYQLSLARFEDPEVRRRLSLSLAISGDRAAALAMIDAQLRRQDRAAWRTRAFVLALTGDTAGATQAVRAVMPAEADALRPFLAKLPSLATADRALAVHFGQFPGEAGMAVSPVPTQTASASVGGPTAAGRPDGSQAPLGGRPAAARPSPTSAVPAGSDRSRRAASKNVPPVRTQPAAAAVPVRQVSSVPDRDVRVASAADRSPANSPPPARSGQPPAQGVVAAQPGFSELALSTAGGAASTVDVPRGQDIAPIDLAKSSVPAASSLPSASVQNAASSSAAGNIGGSAATSARPSDAATSSGSALPAAAREPVAIEVKSFADVAALVASLPDMPPPPASVPAVKSAGPVAKPVTAVPAATRKTGAASVPAATTKDGGTGVGSAGKKGTKPVAKTPSKPAPPKEPSRIWVQVAGGADRSALPREYRRLKVQAPKLFTGRAAWTTPLRATNRLLVGPFPTDKDAQAFVRQLAKVGLGGFSWTSAEGQEIRKLATD